MTSDNDFFSTYLIIRLQSYVDVNILKNRFPKNRFYSDLKFSDWFETFENQNHIVRLFTANERNWITGEIAKLYFQKTKKKNNKKFVSS